MSHEMEVSRSGVDNEPLAPFMSSASLDRLGEATEDEGEHNNLNMYNGVIVPCLLNILGTILFLRLGWCVGQAGWLGTLAIFGIGETQTILTVLSVSAIVTNGNMKGGGSYFMISRSLGPELGGAIGVLFYFAYSMGATFYAIGFATELQTVWWPNEENNYWLLAGLSSCVLFVVLLISLAGAGFFTKINILLFTLQFGAIVLGLVSMWTRPPFDLDGGGRFEGMSVDNFKENFPIHFNVSDQCTGEKCDLQQVFSIVFPAVTGIMEGANLSGDLADPSGTIGAGTLSAVIMAFFTYILLWTSMAFAFTVDVLQNNLSVLQDVSYSKAIMVAGILVATGSSALGSVFGGSRVLQAVARDDLLPGIGCFAKGSKHGDEPRRAVLFTWVLSQSFVFIGNIDAVAPITTSFFCLTYALVNLTCLLLKVSGTVNFRPKWKYWSSYTAFFGMVLNLVVMVWLDVVYFIVAMFCLVTIFVIILMRKRTNDWGDVSQAIIFHQVRKYLLRLDESREHAKTWRLSVLLLADTLDTNLIDFCNLLKKGGLYIVGSVVLKDNFSDAQLQQRKLKEDWGEYIKAKDLKAFSQVAVSHTTMRAGYQNLMTLAGLGAMTPNTIVVPLFSHSTAEESGVTVPVLKSQEAKLNINTPLLANDESNELPVSMRLAAEQNTMRLAEYFQVLLDAVTLDKNIIMGCNFNKYNADAESGEFLDFWALNTHTINSWSEFETQIVFGVQLAHIYKLASKKASTKVRVFVVGPHEEDVKGGSINDQDAAPSRLDILKQYMSDTRLDISVIMQVEGMNNDTAENTNRLIRHHSGNTAMVFVNAPALPSDTANHDENAAYASSLLTLTAGLPPTCLLSAREAASFMSLNL